MLRLLERRGKLEDNPRQRCGICCAHYRVSFYWRKATDDSPDGVPVDLTDTLGPVWRGMTGIDCATTRSIALIGRSKNPWRCATYDHRPSPCRKFEASWANAPNE